MRIAIYGGAFDPVHSEHASILKAVEKTAAPDRLIIVPTADPPHKTGLLASFDERAAMLNATFEGKYEISRLEQELNGKNYSLNSVREFKRRYPADEILFVLGGDSVRDLKLWHKPEELSKLVTFVSVPRDDGSDYRKAVEEAERAFGAKILTVDYVGKDVSSSVLKGKLLLKLPVAGEIPIQAIDYIEKNGLYRDYEDILKKLKDALSERRFAHSTGTALFALKFCSVLALPFREVFLAAMFHDCAKERFETATDGVSDAIRHQYAGADKAKEVYGIKNTAVLDAIRCHTTGKDGMSRLEKLIFAADKLEEGRVYPGADVLRKRIIKDFDSGFAALVQYNYDYLIAEGAEIHPLQRALYQSMKGD